MLDAQKKETYQKWKSLVNMSKSELEKFYNSTEGKVAGLTASQARKAGIDSGRESARWIMKMKDTPVSDWTASMWRWAKKQISFISRMSGMKGDLYDEKGRKTRKHTSLLIWGHNPEKYAAGGKVGGLLAPNGKRSNLTPEQYKLVRTPQFKAWFGFWEENLLIENFLSERGFVMGNGMAFSISDSKILDSVISFIPVDVMDKFGSKKLAIEMLLHDKSMFVDILSLAQRDSFVVSFVNESIIFITISRAKLSNSQSASSNAEIVSASNTLQNNLIFVIDKLSFSSKFSAFHDVSPLAIIRAKFFVFSFDSALNAIVHNDKISDKDKQYITTIQSNALNISKVVDFNGEPMVVYRGYIGEHLGYEFKKGLNIMNKPNKNDFGFFFTPNKKLAQDYAGGNYIEGHVLTVFLYSKNVFDMREFGTTFSDGNEFVYFLESKGISFKGFENLKNEILNVEQIYQTARGENYWHDTWDLFDFFPSINSLLKNNGFDSLLFLDNSLGSVNDSYVVFNSNQIKLADGTNKTFDMNNPDIRFEEGGAIKKPTMFFWHGGNLDDYDEIIAQKNGRYEYGAGLYLTTKWDVASKYSKGSRKLYKVEVEKGVDINDAYLPIEVFHKFIDQYVIASKKKEIKSRLEKHNKEGKAKAYIFNNIILNEKAIKSTNTYKLREFYVENGIDYEIVNNAFGWGEDMMVLYNMKKIVSTEVISPKEKIEEYDLKPMNDKRMKEFEENKFSQGGELNSKQMKIIESPAFLAWFGDYKNDPANASKVVTTDGLPMVVYHGTTHDFFEFTKERGNPENAMGVGYYFSSSLLDVKTNYLTDGADLTSRIETLAERMVANEEEEDYEVAKKKAANELKGKKRRIIKVFLSMKNPMDLRPKMMFFEPMESYNEETDEYEENEDSNSVKLREAMLSVAYNFEAFGDWANNAWNELADQFNYFMDEPDAYSVYVAMGKLSALSDLEDEKGSLANHEYVRQVFEEMGYDGVIMDADLMFGSKRKMGRAMVMDEYTLHFVVFDSNQIKLADGSNTTFDANNPDIRFADGGLIESTINRVLSKEINSDDAAIILYDNGIEVDDQLYNRLRDAETGSLTKGYQVGDKVIVKGKNGLNDFTASYRGKTGNKYVVFPDRSSGLNNQLLVDENEIIGKASFENGGLVQAVKSSKDNLKKNGIVIKSNSGNVMVIAYNSGFHGRKSSLYNQSLIYKEVQKIDKQAASEIIKNFNDDNFDLFDEKKVSEYDNAENLIVLNQDEVVYKSNKKFKSGGMTSKLSEPKTVSEVALKHNMTVQDLTPELIEGIKVEMEHTKDPETAKHIALDHLYESPKYYVALREMEEQLKIGNIDDYYERVKKRFADGGAIDAIYSFKTPTGEPSKLTYIQQVLVRTKAFKDFFGDWELAAKKFIQDGRDNFEYHYKKVSKVLNMVTLEPLVVYHGTRTESEFFEFDVTRKEGIGRPYAYFADNIEYAQNFTRQSQRGAGYGKSYLYEVFLNIRNPLFALGEKIEQQYKGADYWIGIMSYYLYFQRHGYDFDKDNKTKEQKEQMENIIEEVKSQIGTYVKSVYGDSEYPFWRLMAGDVEKKFKTMLMLNKFDGVRYGEEFQSLYDPNDKSQYTRAWVIFDALQVKLADGRNITFDPFNIDIRMEDGGKIEQPDVKLEVKSEVKLSKIEAMKSAIGTNDEMFADGGTVYGDGATTKDAKDGGFFKGKSHADGGIKAVNQDTGQIIEVEGNEVIINKRSVADNTKREFEGEMLTNREILSRINQSGGGVAFADGGELKGNCGCTGKKYKFGGETIEDFLILNKLNGLSETIKTPVEEAREYVDDLIKRLDWTNY